MIVMMGQINAPAVAALATSAPNRSPKLSVFQALVAVILDTERSEAGRMAVLDPEASCMAALRVMILTQLRLKREAKKARMDTKMPLSRRETEHATG